MDIGLSNIPFRSDCLESILAITAELVVLSQILRRVLVELEKACWVIFDISIAKVVQLVA